MMQVLIIVGVIAFVLGILYINCCVPMEHGNDDFLAQVKDDTSTDGVPVTENRVLVKNQTNAALNGIYTANADLDQVQPGNVFNFDDWLKEKGIRPVKKDKER